MPDRWVRTGIGGSFLFAPSIQGSAAEDQSDLFLLGNDGETGLGWTPRVLGSWIQLEPHLESELDWDS